MEEISKRLKIAVLLSASIDVPEKYVGEQETKDSYDKWAKRLFRMADRLIEEENKK